MKQDGGSISEHEVCHLWIGQLVIAQQLNVQYGVGTSLLDTAVKLHNYLWSYHTLAKVSKLSHRRQDFADYEHVGQGSHLKPGLSLIFKSSRYSILWVPSMGRGQRKKVYKLNEIAKIYL